jgi:hypothetical protein
MPPEQSAERDDPVGTKLLSNRPCVAADQAHGHLLAEIHPLRRKGERAGGWGGHRGIVVGMEPITVSSEVDPKNWTTINVIKPGGKKPMGEITWHGSAWSRVRR